jgi:hypothetical protein
MEILAYRSYDNPEVIMMFIEDPYVGLYEP